MDLSINRSVAIDMMLSGKPVQLDDFPVSVNIPYKAVSTQAPILSNRINLIDGSGIN